MSFNRAFLVGLSAVFSCLSVLISAHLEQRWPVHIALFVAFGVTVLVVKDYLFGE